MVRRVWGVVRPWLLTRAKTKMGQYGNCRDPCTNADAVFSSKSQLKVNSEKKIRFFPLRNFRFLYQQRIRCYNTLLSIFRSIICHVAHGRLKLMENFKLLALKAVAVAYERRSLTRGSKYSNLTWKLLVFWKTSR